MIEAPYIGQRVALSSAGFGGAMTIAEVYERSDRTLVDTVWITEKGSPESLESLDARMLVDLADGDYYAYLTRLLAEEDES